jgi:hypothetical protein
MTLTSPWGVGSSRSTNMRNKLSAAERVEAGWRAIVAHLETLNKSQPPSKGLDEKTELP